MLPLQQLATDKFGPLTAAELKLLEAVPAGTVAECGSADAAENDPNKADSWKEDRTIRSSIIKWLCSDKGALAFNDALRILVSSAKFIGELDLEGISLGFSLTFAGCAFPEGITLGEARLRKLDLTGTVCGNLMAWGLNVEGNVFLRLGFRSHGPVVLVGASVRGDLEFIEAILGEPTEVPKPPLKIELPPNIVLWADRLNVGGKVVMNNMKAHGVISMNEATITSGFDCNDAFIKTALVMRDTQARSMNFGGCHCAYLIGDRLNLKGSLFLRAGFEATGSVVLLNSSISGDLDCHGSTFGTLEPDEETRTSMEAVFGGLPPSPLTLNGSVISGYLYLSHDFQAYGRVNCDGVTVGLNFFCSGGKFFAAGAQSLSCQFSEIKGAVLCRKIFRDETSADKEYSFQTDGVLDFFGTRIASSVSFSGAEFQGNEENGVNLQNANIGGTLQWRNVVVSPGTKLNLSQLKIGLLEDDDQSWPANGNLVLDGFSYDAIANVPLSTKRRAVWLKSHLEYLKRQAPDDFTLQPHRQLADILRKSGYEDNARDVLIDMHKARREQGGFNKFGWVASWILQGAIGFGYRSHRTLLWALGFVILGAVLFNAAYRAGVLVSPKPDAQPVTQFSAIGYSIDSFLPIINLHQEELWVPSGFGAGRWIQYYYWIHICLGWALITLGVAGFTGLIRKE